MSREQWGHGYWKGVKDTKARYENESANLYKDIVLRACECLKDTCGYLCICSMQVKAVRIMWRKMSPPIPDKYHKAIYEYIKSHKSSGFYVEGDADWEDNFFSIYPEIEIDMWNKPFREHGLIFDRSKIQKEG